MFHITRTEECECNVQLSQILLNIQVLQDVNFMALDEYLPTLVLP